MKKQSLLNPVKKQKRAVALLGLAAVLFAYSCYNENRKNGENTMLTQLFDEAQYLPEKDNLNIRSRLNKEPAPPFENREDIPESSPVFKTEIPAEKQFSLPEVSIQTGQQTISAPSDGSKEPDPGFSENPQGIIGKSEEFPIDDPQDNTFPVVLNELPGAGQGVYLTYELIGLEDAAGAAVSINDHFSRGGYLVKKSKGRITHRERINPEELNKGVNYIRFSTLPSAAYAYIVKNVRLEISDSMQQTEAITLNRTQLKSYGGSVYVSGFADKSLQSITINRKETGLRDGVFEAVVENAETEIVISAAGQDYHFPVSEETEEEPDKITLPETQNETVSAYFTASSENTISDFGATLNVPAASMEKDRTFYLSALRFQDVSALSPEMVNVTAGHSGFRLLPHGEHFVSSPATLEIPYDETMIPAGYRPQDIKTFYFDNRQRKWIALERDTVLLDKKVIVSKTTHFTDFVNGIIKVPESPETGNFTPTSIKDIKAADPAAGIVSIAPPTPNNMGTATTGFPIKLPAGRAGMQPSLSVNYNSEGGNGWMGIGWDLSLPSVSIDTRWGAPRYDTAKETEIYSLAGSMLTLSTDGGYTNPHRTENISRTSERQFYPRIEGSYAKIIRHGSNPTNYWWEVTDKMGNKSFYGGYTGSGVVSNAVIKTSDGNIAHWALYRTEDTNGNYVQYSYAQGTGTAGYEFYPKEISYTRHTDQQTPQYYKVTFILDSAIGTPSSRTDIQTNARLGLVQSTSKLLNEIKIELTDGLNPEKIRSYKFDYDDKAFSKKQLIKISEFDANDDLFYSNTMDYYEEVTDGNFMDTEPKTDWNGVNDGINGNPKLPSVGEKFVWKGSLLGFNRGNGFTGGLSAGVGLGANVASKKNTVGVTYDYSFSKNTGYISFIDINGDNLPDKVFKTSGGIKYRLNLGEDMQDGTPFGFGPIQSLSGSSDFSVSTSNSNSVGVESNFGVYIGYTRNFSKSVTKVYYSDVNGDGLIDIVNNGSVLFNPGPGFSSFNIASLTTPNLIPTDTSLDPGIIGDINSQLNEDLEGDNPLQDIVKRWVAPKSGTISLSGIAKLAPLPIPSQEDDTMENNDGVCISVEHHKSQSLPALINFTTPGTSCPNSSNKYLLTFTFNDNGEIVPTEKNMSKSIQVSQGDRLYFRVQSREEGTHDRVEWNPVISYNQIGGSTDANGLDFFSSSANDGFILTGRNYLVIPKNKNYSIKWDNLTIQPNQYSDDLTFRMRLGHLDNEGEFVQDASYTKQVFHTNSTPYTLTPSAMGIPNSYSSGSTERMIYFEVMSDSNVDWKQINWKPYSAVEEIPSAPPVETNAVVDYGIYNFKPFTERRTDVSLRDITRRLKFIISYTNETIITEEMENEFPNGSYSVSLVIKNSNKQVVGKKFMTAGVSSTPYPFTNLYKKMFSLTNSGDWIINDTSKLTSKIYVEFYTTNKYLAHYLNAETIIHDEILPNVFQSFTSANCISAKIGNDDFGPNYRYWGHFAYNGNEPGLWINESKLKLPEIDEDNMPDPDIYDECGDDPDCFEANSPDLGIDPKSMPFIVLYPNPNKQFEDNGPYFEVWEGNDAETFVQGNALSSSRLGINDLESIRIDFDGDPGAVRRMPLISKGDGNSYAGSFGIGPVGAGSSKSDNENRTLIQYMDLNGDRYPDIVTENKIQYTNPIGKLSEIKPTGLGVPSISNTDGSGVTASGTFINFKTPGLNQDVQRAIAKSRGLQLEANADVQLPSSAGINASGNWSDTDDKSLWIDMNGDGLPDRVTIENKNLVVRLNLGYSFETQGSIWKTNITLKSKNSNFSGGAGFSLWMNSIAGGISVSAGEAYTEKNFIDLNGDGLPDLVENPDAQNITYFLNTGNRFSTFPHTINGAAVNVNRSVGEGANIAFTVGFTILLAKFTVTPRVSVSSSADRTEQTIADINGDGYPDILYTATGSNAADGNLSVRLNKTGKTHLLRRVNLPLGGHWEIDYEREQNSYEMPNAKWKLDSIYVYDGFTADNAFTPDIAKTTVEYENPRHDRREREFMGYEKVRVNQLDVKNSDEIYRYSLQEFHTNSYYLKGAVKKESLYDKNDVLWTSTETTYAIMARGNTNPAIVEKPSDYVFGSADFGEPIDKASLFVSPVKTIRKFTEGGSGLKTTFTEIQAFDAYGNITQFMDNGEGGNDAVTSYIGYQTTGYDTPYFKGYPVGIRVIAADGSTRQRKADYDFNAGTANLTSVETWLTGSEKATVSFDYDAYGNIEKVTHEDSKDENGDPFYYEYTYDSQLHTYPVKTEDAFGYSSQNTYDYRFGALVYSVDMNYKPMRTRIDDRGRVVEITGPYELFVEGLTIIEPAWTIRFEYEGELTVAEQVAGLEFTDYLIDAAGKFEASGNFSTVITNAKHHAVTRHFDPEFRTDPDTPETENEIYTITLIDGLGKPIQVKKSTSVFDKTDTVTGEPDASVIDYRDKLFWLVNGKVETDAFGRAVKTWYPVLENYDDNTPLNTTALSYNATPYETGENFYTEATYDVLDRVKTTRLPGETAEMLTSYSIESSLFKTTVVNELSQTKHSFTDVRGRTAKVVEDSNDAGTISTQFTYNAIGELLEVEDTDGNITESKYDMAGRRTELRHPDNGITKFTYDKASNLIAKQTANLLAENNGDKIEYFYTFNRLDSIVYPKNPHNNVHFFYGQAQDASAADDFSVGRLWYQIDATGVQQFKYGRLGEVRYNLRSVAVPGDKAYWFKTEWEYDTWNRVKKIIYPDEEEVTYFYNRGGELHGITSKKENQQNADIISQLGYDKFGQRTYLRYGNGTETEYSYETDRRRLLNMTAKSNTANGSSVDRTFINNSYTYDVLSNVLSVENTAALPTTGQIGGSVLYEYEYDDLNRLKTATGNFTGRNTADTGHEYQKYSLLMSYDNMHNILGKTQVHETSPDNTNWTKAHQTTYDLTYQEYNTAEYNVAGYSYTQPHAVRQITDKPETTSTGNDVKTKIYDYDPNGNLTAITQKTGDSEAVEKLRTNLWDEENRLRAVDITPDAEGVRPIAIYTYDAGGERILKYSNTSVSIYLNGKKVADTIQVDAALYPSGMLVAKLGSNGSEEQTLAYTKHYFAGTQRVSSKIGTTENLGDYLYDWFTQGTGGPVDVIGSSFGVLENAEQGVVQVYDEFDIEPPVYDSNPVFIPVQSFVHGDDELEQYFFHPDHLGSTSYITNLLGEVSQHMEYFAFGETFVEEHRSSNNSPYKFNGKELDEETGWYYYGARYYDPRVSVLLSVDPLANMDYLMNDEAYISGEHNDGIFNSFNHNSYGYCYQNPIKFIDPNGKQTYWQNNDSYKNANLFEKFLIDVLFSVDFLSREAAPHTISAKLFNEGKADDRFMGNLMFIEGDISLFSAPSGFTSKSSYKSNVSNFKFTKLGVFSGKLITNNGKSFKLSSIRFSQNTINNYNRALHAVKNGTADPIDIVKMKDGMYTTLDNTRLLAARNSGSELKANVHNYDDLIPKDVAERLASPSKKGVLPKTWGEAIEMRTNSQTSEWRKAYGGTGSFVKPKINSY